MSIEMKRAGRFTLFLLLLIFAATAARAQERVLQTEDNVGSTTTHRPDRRSPEVVALTRQTHKFWDYENVLLFAGVTGARGLDYSSTLNIRRRGLNEVLLTNAIVDNHPAFGGIEAAGAATSILVSYLFHRSGHHRLERLTSIVHIGVALAGAGRNYALKTNHST